MPTPSLPTYGIPIRVPPELRARLQAEKELTGMSVNAIINAVLNDYFERQDADAEHERSRKVT